MLDPAPGLPNGGRPRLTLSTCWPVLAFLAAANVLATQSFFARFLTPLQQPLFAVCSARGVALFSARSNRMDAVGGATRDVGAQHATPRPARVVAWAGFGCPQLLEQAFAPRHGPQPAH